MKKIILVTLLLASSLFLLVVILGHVSHERQGTVTAEPLTCQKVGQQLVCYDNGPQGDLNCEDLGNQIIFCFSQT